MNCWGPTTTPSCWKKTITDPDRVIRAFGHISGEAVRVPVGGFFVGCETH
jgi:hypothetical protein